MTDRHAKAAGPRVTDHALVRILERSGLDVEAVRSAIADALAAAHGAALTLGGGDHLIVVDGLAFVVRAGAVTTVIPAGSPGDRGRMLDRSALR